MEEAKDIRTHGLRNGNVIDWHPSAVDVEADTQHTDWASEGNQLPVQVAAVNEDYMIKANANHHAIALEGLIYESARIGEFLRIDAW